MSRRPPLVALLLGCAWLACARAADQAPHRVLATLTRQTCPLGVCPDYSLTIYEDGSVLYEGRAHVKEVGTRKKLLPAGKLAQIVAAFEKTQYFSLKDRYAGGPTDMAWVYTSYNKNGRTKQVAHYSSGDAGAPPALDELERRIDDVVGTLEWTGTVEEAWKRVHAASRAADEAARARLPELRRLLQDANVGRRRKAAYDLLSLWWLVDAADKQAAAPVVAEALADADGNARAEAAAILIQFGPEAAALVPALTNTLKDPNPKIREQAAGALFRIGRAATPAATVLARTLRDRDPSVRGEAARALASLGPSAGAAVAILAADLEDKDELVRNTALDVLNELGPAARQALPALTRALKDTSPSIRGLAAQVLGRIGPAAQPAAPALREALADPVPTVRDAARAALERIEAAR